MFVVKFSCRCVVLVMLSICLIVSVFATEQPQELKVGYVSNYGTLKAGFTKGSEGYGYEYLKKIFDYADGNYNVEFVYCEWEESKEMLENGKLDIIGPTTYTEAGAQIYGYPDQSSGDNMIFLSTHSEKVSYYSNYGNINGAKIAVQTNNPNAYLLDEFLQENNIDAEIVYFSDNDYETAMENLDVDLVVASSLQYFQELAPIATLGVLDFYYVTNVENTELLEIMNEAMEELEKQEFMYQEQLYLEYYNYTINSSHYITEEEYDLLQSKTVYYVGIEDFYSPICYTDSSGNLAGIAVDVTEMLASAAGIFCEFVPVTSEMSDAVAAVLDFSFVPFTEDGRNTSIETDAYCSVPFLLIERKMPSGEDIENIGILGYYGITELELEDHIYGRTMCEYYNIVELQDAYNAGEIDSFIVSTSTLNAIRSGFEDLDFISKTMDMSLNLTIQFPEDATSEQIRVFNKLIAQLNQTEIDNSVFVHTTVAAAGYSDNTLVEVVQANLLVSKIVFGLAILLLLFAEWKRRGDLARVINIDKLTGLASYHAFVDKGEKLIARGESEKYAIVSLDIDNFKYINESYGYEAGSNVLKAVATNLKEYATDADIVAKADADNFLLLVKKDGLMEGIESSVIRERNFYEKLKPFVGDTYTVTFSLGIYNIVDEKLDLSFMIDCANMARALGKDTAHTTINLFTPDMDKARITSNDIVANMGRALEKEEFALFYQPKVNLITGEMVGAEALVRWFRDGKMVPPLDFISLFERNGFIEQLDYYVLSKACEFVAKNPGTPKISVNFSGVTIMKDGLEERVVEILNKYSVPFSKIDMEITETAFVEKFENSLHKIEALRKLGITISMDDFGEGISSLNRLKNIPIDIIKIDRGFIVDSIENPRGAQIIKNVIQMAKDLNLETVAEGIETKEQEEFLKNLGCDVGQGYLFSRPVPERDFAEMLKKQK